MSGLRLRPRVFFLTLTPYRRKPLEGSRGCGVLELESRASKVPTPTSSKPVALLLSYFQHVQAQLKTPVP